MDQKSNDIHRVFETRVSRGLSTYLFATRQQASKPQLRAVLGELPGVVSLSLSPCTAYSLNYPNHIRIIPNHILMILLVRTQWLLVGTPRPIGGKKRLPCIWPKRLPCIWPKRNKINSDIVQCYVYMYIYR